MANMQQITLDLPEEAIRLIQRKVAAGEYTSASTLVADALDRLTDDAEEQEADLDAWIYAHADEIIAEANRPIEEMLTLDQVRDEMEKHFVKLRRQA